MRKLSVLLQALPLVECVSNLSPFVWCMLECCIPFLLADCAVSEAQARFFQYFSTTSAVINTSSLVMTSTLLVSVTQEPRWL